MMTLRWPLLVGICVCLVAGCCLRGGILTGPSTPDFLGPADFRGSYYPQRHAVTWGGQTRFIGDAMFTNLSRSAVESILPADLKLADNISSHPLEHPVIVLFGRQTELTWHFFDDGNVPAGEPYNEMMLLIPFVQKKGGSDKWHNYVVRMYLDWQWGVDAGNVNYGYRKEFANFEWQDFATPPPVYAVKVTQTATKFTADVRAKSAWMSDAAAMENLANFAALKTIFRMPVLGTWPPSMGGTYLCTYFEWDFADSQVRRSDATYQFVSEFVAGMPWVGQPLSNVDEGGFGIDRVRWRLTTATLCSF